MSNFNPNYPLQQLNDGLCSIEMLKSLVENPLQVASTMFQFTNYQHKALQDYQFMVKYLQEVYNPPDNNLQLSKQRQQDLHLMRPPDASQVKKAPVDKTVKPMIDPKKQPEKFFQPLVFPKGYGFNPNAFPAVYHNQKMHPMFQTPVMNQFEPAPPAKTPVEVNKGINAKRKPPNFAAPFSEYPKKKLKGTSQEKSPVPKNANIIELDDDDDEAEIIPKEVAQIRTKKPNNAKPPIRPLFRTGEKKNQQPYKAAPIEIIDSPELIISKEQFLIEEEKDGATTNATNFDDFTKDGGESKDEALDIFDLNIDDLGIKILGEVFLCEKCQKEIPQKDVDKGFKEICASCSKKLNKVTKPVTGNKKNSRNTAAYKEELLKYEQQQENSNSIEDNGGVSSKEDETASKYDILAPVYQARDFYEDTKNLNIMNSDQNQKPTLLGKTHQTAIIPLNIYAKGKNKKMRKLWNPEKLDHSAYEKFRNDVNGKNSVYLLDEEITEILVRFKYNIEQALTWSMKSNPEFQYYVKKSANRRRIMTRGTGRGYSNIYE